jgi:ABC-type transporter Mla subunit MlaD
MASAQGIIDPWNSYVRADRRDNRREADIRYQQRFLRDAIKRVKNHSDDFQSHLDRALDHSRLDDSHREDQINDTAKEFRQAAVTLDNRFDAGRNLNRSASEARRLLQVGSRIDRLMGRNRFDVRAEADWVRIRQDLKSIANAYGFNWSEFDDRFYQRDDNHRNRNDRRNNYPW